MFAMFAKIFSAITVFGTVLESLANTLLHLSSTAEAKAKAFAEECAIENESTLSRLRSEAAVQTAALPQINAPATTTTTTV